MSKSNDKTDEKKESRLWKAIARYQAGTSHIKDDIPCQDYAKYEVHGKYFIGAVADGAGSCTYSQEGSQIAVTSTLEYFAEMFGKLNDNDVLFKSEADAKEKFRDLIKRVRDEIGLAAGKKSKELEHDLDKKDKISPRQFSCTLLAFVAFPEGIAAMQLGDGFIVVRDYGKQEYDLLFLPSKGEFVNETTFVTSDDIGKKLQITYRPNRVSFVCASTDGLENIAIKSRRDQQDQAYARFFVPLEDYMQSEADPEKADDYIMSNFLNSDEFNRKTNDDKTLLVCSSTEADAVPEMPEKEPPEDRPNPTRRSSTPPPIISHRPSPKRSNSQPDGLNKPKLGNPNSTSIEQESKTLNPRSKRSRPKSPTSVKTNQKRPSQNSHVLASLRKKAVRTWQFSLIPAFLCLYFATITAINIVQKIESAYPISIWIAGFVIVFLFLFFTVSLVLLSPNNKKNRRKSQANEVQKEINDAVVIQIIFILFLVTPILLGFTTLHFLNSNFSHISNPISEPVSLPLGKSNPNTPKPNNPLKPKIN
ncbi:MAG: PP2C family serine/threonine-protein phosphatase [Pseudanabaena sp.]